MERADRKIGSTRLLFEPLHHLRCGLVGEGEGEDLIRFHSRIDKVEDLFGDHPCFA